jgi:hypothetical protein
MAEGIKVVIPAFVQVVRFTMWWKWWHNLYQLSRFTADSETIVVSRETGHPRVWKMSKLFGKDNKEHGCMGGVWFRNFRFNHADSGLAVWALRPVLSVSRFDCCGLFSQRQWSLPRHPKRRPSGYHLLLMVIECPLKRLSKGNERIINSSLITMASVFDCQFNRLVSGLC